MVASTIVEPSCTVAKETVQKLYELALRRRNHLNALHRNGRWKRYHTEQTFVDYVRQATLAIETWRRVLDEVMTRPGPDSPPSSKSHADDRQQVVSSRERFPSSEPEEIVLLRRALETHLRAAS